MWMCLGAASYAVLFEGLAGGVAEDAHHVLGVAKAGLAGDLLDGHVGRGEEFADSGETHPLDLLVDGTAEDVLEAGFERGAGDADSPQDIGGLDAVAGVLPDEEDGLRDAGVFGGDDIARHACDDSRGSNDRFAIGDGAAGHHAIEQGGGLVADSPGVQVDAGQRGQRQIAEAFVVADAGDGDFVGHFDAGAAAGVEHEEAEVVVAGHDGAGAVELLEPSADLPTLGFPAVAARDGLDIELVVFPAGLLDEAAKLLGAGVHGLVRAGGQTDEGEPVKSALAEMLDNEAGDQGIVGAHGRHAL